MTLHDEFIADPELLLPELRGSIVEGSRTKLGWTILHSPLVIQVPFYSASMANTMFQQKSERIAELKKEGLYEEILGLHERPYRLPTLYEWYQTGEISTEQLRKILPWAWVDTEDPPYEECEEMFIECGYCSDNEEKLTGTLAIYRGSSEEEVNIEWSLNRKKAEWFARRWKCPTPTLAIAEIDAQHVLAYFTGRGEAEVIVQTEHLKNVRFERLT